MTVFHCRALAGLLTITWLAPVLSSLSARQAVPVEAGFTIFAQGRDVGTERVSVARTSDGWLVSGSGRLTAPIDIVIRRFEARYDREWRPRDLTVEASTRGEPLEIRTTFAAGEAQTALKVGAADTGNVQKVSPEAIILIDNFFGSYEALAARLATMTPGAETPVYFARQTQVGLRLDAVRMERIQGPSRSLEARRYGVTFLVPGNPIGGEVWADASGRLLKVVFPGWIQSVRDDVATAATRLAPVTHPGDEELRIPASGFTISATLSRPATAAPRTGFPLVVLVPGAGAADRDEVTGGVPVYGVLAGQLADAGYLAARYDKRGASLTGGRPETATLSDHADDVRAVVKELRARRDVDRRRIALVGYGDAGWVALLAAAREDNVTGVVLAATPATTGADFVLERQEYALVQMKLPESEREAKIDLQKRIHTAVLSGASWEGIPPELRRQAETPAFQSLLAFDPVAAVPRVRQPILVLYGSVDPFVTAEDAARLEETAKARKGNRIVAVVPLSGLDNRLTSAPTGQDAPQGPSLGPTVDRSVSQAIVTWLQGLAAKS
jgi:dienelactone hydrolase